MMLKPLLMVCIYIYDGQKTDDSEDDKVNRLDNKFRHKVLS